MIESRGSRVTHRTKNHLQMRHPISIHPRNHQEINNLHRFKINNRSRPVCVSIDPFGLRSAKVE